VLPPLAVSVALAPEQIVAALAVIVGSGLIVIVKVNGDPVQPANVGVTTIAAVIGLVPGLVAVNEGNPPVPLTARPIAVFELVQLNVAPAGVLANEFAPIVVPAQALTFDSAFTLGVGLTVTVDTAVPVQPEVVPVTV
jgi:hypothetical protein